MPVSALRSRIEAMSPEKRAELISLLEGMTPEQRAEVKQRFAPQQEAALPDFSRAIPVDSSLATADISASLIDQQALTAIDTPQVERGSLFDIPASTSVGFDLMERLEAENVRQHGTLQPADQSVLDIALSPARSIADIGLGGIAGLSEAFGLPEPSETSILGKEIIERSFTGSSVVGRFMGEATGLIAQYYPATSVVGHLGKIKAFARLPDLVRQPIKAMLIGSGTATGRELIDLAKGGSFDAKAIAFEGAIFGFFDAILLGGGKLIKAVIRNRNGKAMSKYLDEEIAAGRISDLNQLEKDNIIRAVQTGEAASHAESQRLALLGKNSTVNQTFGETNIKTNLSGQLDLAGNPILVKRRIQIQLPAVLKHELEEMKKWPILPKVEGVRQGKGFVSKLVNAAYSAQAALENPQRFFEKVSPQAVKMFLDPTREATHRAGLALKEVTRELEKLKKSPTTKGKITSRIPGIQEGSSRRIDAWAVSQQAGGVDILKANGVKIPQLNDRELEIYNWMRDVFEVRFGQLQQARKLSGNAPLNKVENYFTFFRNLQSLEAAGESALTVLPETMTDQFIRTRSTAFRFGKSRANNEKGGIELDAFNHFVNYNKSALDHIELSPVIAKIDQYLNGKFIDGFSLMETNGQFHQTASNWLNFVSGKTPEILPPSINAVLTSVNKSLTYAILSGSVRSALIQPSAYVNTMTLIGPKWAMRGAKDLFFKKKRAFALKNSNVLDGRVLDAAIVEAMSAVGHGATPIREKIGQIGLWPLKFLDMGTASATWLGAFARGRELLKMSGKGASRYADEIVVKTQGSASRIDISPLQRTALGKAVTPFQTFTINQWGLITRDIAGIGARKGQISQREKMERFATFITGMSLVNVVFEEGLGTFSPFPDPISALAKELEKSDDVGKAIASAIFELGEFVPVVGGGARYGSSPFGAQADFWTTLMQIVAEPAGIGRGVGKRKVARTIGTALGIPGTSQAVKILLPFEER